MIELSHRKWKRKWKTSDKGKIEVCFLRFPKRQGAFCLFYAIGEAFELVEIDVLLAG